MWPLFVPSSLSNASLFYWRKLRGYREILQLDEVVDQFIVKRTKDSINSYILHQSTKQLQSPQNRQTSWRSIIWLSWELYRRLVPISSSQRTSRHFQHKDVHENGFERVDTLNEDESNAPTILPSVISVLSCWNVTRHDLLHIWAVQGEVRNVSWKHRVE